MDVAAIQEGFVANDPISISSFQATWNVEFKRFSRSLRAPQHTCKLHNKTSISFSLATFPFVKTLYILVYVRILYVYIYMLCYHRALCLCALVVSTDSLVSGAITMTVQNYCSTVTTNFPKHESLYQTEDGQNFTKLDKTCLAELRLSHCPYVTLTDLSRRNCWSLEVS